MKQVKFLHCADLHLEAPFTSLGSAEKARIRRQELKDCFRNIVRAAVEDGAELLLICGDLYEHGYADKAALTAVAAGLGSVPGLKTVIIPGNHDPYTGNSLYKIVDWPDNVYILAEGNSYVTFEELGVRIYSQDCTEELLKGDSRDGTGVFRPDLINILMLHGTLDMGFSKNAWNPFESRELDRLGMDYVAFGHFHSRLEGGGGAGSIYNPGSPEPMGFDETGRHGVFTGRLIKRSSGEVEREVRFLPLNQRNYIRLEVGMDGCGAEEEAVDRVLDAVRQSGNGNDLYEIRLTGFTRGEFSVDTVYVARRLEKDAWFVKIADESLPGYDFESIAREPGLRGLFTRKMLQRLEAADSDAGRRQAERALVFGLQAIDSGRIADIV